VQRGLETLPPDQRAVVVLVDIQEFKYDEVAQALGISLGTVKSRLNRGRRKLRDFLQSDTELLPPRYRLDNKTGSVAGLASFLFCRLTACWLVQNGWLGDRR
jgi:RNA polymerase sigma-70 factor (ECF subfamily)